MVTNLPKAPRGQPGEWVTQDDSAAVITPTLREIISVADALPTTDPEHWTSQEGRMGLVLFPGDGDVTSPDISWSYTGFSMFRTWLAQAEGFVLAEMYGFGGDRLWTSVSTTLAPLLNHPDDAGPNLTPAQCAAMLPRLEAIIDERQRDGSTPVLGRPVDDACQLVTVMKFCLNKDVEVIFG
ncbi:hypothetical protein [Streptomyces sp. NPDC060184]|uniref:hypothetical protein n=1 Tax=Streptomyces sp. NPDC060184 TaxID=3347064 RepID=UPI00364EFD44